MFILLLGFSSGLPYNLVAGTLSAWLREVEVSRTAIGLFAYVFTPYTLKFLWAPLVDRMPLPWLTRRLGRRRSWMLLSQLALMACIFGLAQTDPRTGLLVTACWALAVAFCAATQDIAIDAYRVEILPRARLGAGAAMVVTGYRIAMWVSGACTLFLAFHFGWTHAYSVMATLVLAGMVTTLLIPEPAGSAAVLAEGPSDLAAQFRMAVVEPFTDFFARHGVRVAVVILLFISLYKACDVLLTLMANPFYLDVGFTLADIAEISGTFGILMTVLGGIAGGALVFRIGIMRALLIGGILQASSNLMFALLASIGPSRGFFYLTVGVDNLSAGLGTAAFVAYLSSLCAIHYTAVQYALLTSFMQMLGKYLIVPSSGFLADALGWHLFFISSTLLALPGLALVIWLGRQGLEVPKEPRPTAPPAPA